ncbi:MAG: UDP-N-acetylmuramate dehydrogenase [Oscillospiraceae bacterium]|nr:UDP-N-acetylmuramate dehydrogenase [Oscillospiraceae bacterium]
MEEIVEKARSLGCKCLCDQPLAPHTTFGIGGSTPLFIDITAAAFAPLLRLLEERGLPYYVIGRGSNLLVADEGTDRVILHCGRLMDNIALEGGTLVCEAGAPLTAVCVAARDAGLSGLEFAYGIPASVGGGVYMNAGAYGGELKDVLLYADILDTAGNMRRYSNEELDLSYRHSALQKGGLYVVRAAFALEKGDGAQITAKMDELMQRRLDKQPLNFKSAGSTFKRPQGAYAAALIDECGLKGYTAGGAQVSEKHAGFVINTGGATFADVMAVTDHVRAVVKEKTGFELELEPEILS